MTKFVMLLFVEQCQSTQMKNNKEQPESDKGGEREPRMNLKILVPSFPLLAGLSVEQKYSFA